MAFNIKERTQYHAENIAETQYSSDYYDLPGCIQAEIYSQAEDLAIDDFAAMMDAVYEEHKDRGIHAS